MSKNMVTFRLERSKTKALDRIAQEKDRDRSYILNEAIDAYLEVNEWQINHIKEGLRQADAKKYATDKEVKVAFAKWRR